MIKFYACPQAEDTYKYQIVWLIAYFTLHRMNIGNYGDGTCFRKLSRHNSQYSAIIREPNVRYWNLNSKVDARSIIRNTHTEFNYKGQTEYDKGT